MKYRIVAALIAAACLCAQTENRGLEALRFLEGTWDAKTQQGTARATSTGTYTFVKELRGHILARHSATADCKGPAEFNCEHSDLLWVYEEGAGKSLKAIYFDNEGHTIHYAVSTPTATNAVFISDASAPGPQYRLTYELSGSIMSGRFQMKMPGQTNWTSYLEWSGEKR